MTDEFKVEDLQPIESGITIDLRQYEGQKVAIEKLAISIVPSKYGLDGKLLPPGQTIEQKILRVYTAPLAIVEKKDGSKVEIRADESFNLKKDKNGKDGWSTSDKSKIQKLFKKLGVNKPEELKGKQVMVKTRPNKDGTRLFLGFVY